jgi:hypothetical protein
MERKTLLRAVSLLMFALALFNLYAWKRIQQEQYILSVAFYLIATVYFWYINNVKAKRKN